MTRSRLRGAVCATLISIAASCGPSATGTGSDRTSKGEIVIAYDGPLSGADGVTGRLPMLGAQLAVEEEGSISGYTLTFVPLDDAVNGVHLAEKAVEHVRAMVADARVLGIIGPYNSNVALAIIPVANAAGLPIVSPSNSFPCLTQPADLCAKTPAELRPTGRNSYFRVSATDSDQGSAMAQFALEDLKVGRAAVLSDTTAFGRFVAGSFARRFASGGGSVVLRREFGLPPPSDFRPFLVAARDAGAEAIYMGAGLVTRSCVVRAQMQGIFSPDAYFLGTDSITGSAPDGDCVSQAGRNANEHVYASVAADDATQSGDPAVKRVVAAYREKFAGQDASTPYTFAAYDAAKILIRAIERAIAAAGGRFPQRQQVVDELARTTDHKGVAGTYTFDANGDTVHPVLSIYRISDRRWTYVQRIVLSSR